MAFTTTMRVKKPGSKQDPDLARARRRTSLGEQAIKAGAKQGDSTAIRYSIICRDLKTSLKGFSNKARFMEIFDSQARTQGVYRKVVGLLANAVVQQCTEAGELPPPINKTFFDRCWSAIDRARKKNSKSTSTKKGSQHTKKGSQSNSDETDIQSTNVITPYLERFTQETGFNVCDLPAPVPFDTRQATARDMETVAVNHIVVMLEKRLHAYFCWRIANIPSAHHVKLKIVRGIARKLVSRSMKGSTELEAGFHPDISHDEVAAVLNEVGREIRPIIPTNPRQSVSKSFRKNAHLLLPLLRHISSEFGRVNTERRNIKTALLSQIPHHTMSRSQIRSLLTPLYCAHGLLLPGKEFALLPDWQVTPAFVDYTTTELETLFGKKLGQLNIFEQEIFDLSRTRKHIQPDWHLMGFRTNGVELHLRFGALQCRHPDTPNVADLKDAGYCIRAPKFPIDMVTAQRGVYRVTESRFDNEVVPPEHADSIKIVVVDPGVCKVVCVREIMLNKCSDAKIIKKNSVVWDVTEKEWKKQMNSDMTIKMERKRRRWQCTYRNTLERLHRTRKKTAIWNTYVEYATTIVRHLRSLSRELSSRARRVTRWLSQKNTMRAMDKLADRLCGMDKKGNKDEPGVRRVVFYGDGLFKAKRGHVSVPNKSLVEVLFPPSPDGGDERV